MTANGDRFEHGPPPLVRLDSLVLSLVVPHHMRATANLAAVAVAFPAWLLVTGAQDDCCSWSILAVAAILARLGFRRLMVPAIRWAKASGVRSSRRVAFLRQYGDVESIEERAFIGPILGCYGRVRTLLDRGYMHWPPPGVEMTAMFVKDEAERDELIRNEYADYIQNCEVSDLMSDLNYSIIVRAGDDWRASARHLVDTSGLCVVLLNSSPGESIVWEMDLCAADAPNRTVVLVCRDKSPTWRTYLSTSTLNCHVIEYSVKTTTGRVALCFNLYRRLRRLRGTNDWSTLGGGT